MALTITSLSSLTAYRYLLVHQEAITRSMERLSSGHRINRAPDDVPKIPCPGQLRCPECSNAVINRKKQQKPRKVFNIDVEMDLMP